MYATMEDVYINSSTAPPPSADGMVVNMSFIPTELLLVQTSNCTDEVAFHNLTRANREAYSGMIAYLQDHQSYAKTLYGIFVPILTIITIVVNTLIVLVLAKPKMRTPTNLVLLCMALSDIFTVIPPTPWFMYLYTFGNHEIPPYPPSFCYVYIYMTEVLPNLFHTASIWLTLMLALQRYIYVCKAAIAAVCCTKPRVTKGIFLIYVAAALHQSTKFVDFQVDTVPICWNGELRNVCSISRASWVVGYENYYFNFYFWFRVIFIHLIPCVALITLNIFLCSTLKAAQVRRLELLGQKSKRAECIRLRDSQITTLMLVVVVAVFLLVEIPLAVLTILHIVDSMFGSFLDYDMVNLLIIFCNFSITASYPINFAIYCGMSKQFRESFKELFTGSSTPSSSTYMTEAEHSRVGGAAGLLRKGSAAAAQVSAKINGKKNSTNETAL